jgi:Tol biopolymer transport system component
MDADGSRAAAMTGTSRAKHDPAFSSDGLRIAFVREPKSGLQIRIMNTVAPHSTNRLAGQETYRDERE